MDRFGRETEPQPPSYFTPNPAGAVDEQAPLGTNPRHRKSGPPWVMIAGALVVLLLVGGLAWSRLGDDGDKPATTPSETAARAAEQAQPTDPDNPFYLPPNSTAAKQVAEWKAAGREADAEQIEKIASQPVATWFAYDGADVAGKIDKLMQGAADAGRIPVLVAYNVPHRDCGQYSSGGAADDAAYRNWLKKLSTSIGDRKGLLILEPDALAHTLDGCLEGAEATARYALISEAITTLKTSNPNLKVYLDGGNSAWLASDKMVGALQAAGIESADGFALNVSNFETTEANIRYGTAISQQLGGKHFVIDTSRNGNGPYPDKSEENHWCNPPGRALGASPTTKTGNPLVDAFLWIKQPGDSDGQCRDGAPKAGAWWPEYALTLAKATK